MKYSMSPSRAYLLGLWKGRRTAEGIGVEGRGDLCEIFLKACLDEGFASTDKVKFTEDERGSRCYFYNTALRKWLEDEIGKREERLRFKNEFAANYFAGVFDSRGGWRDSVKGELIPYLMGDKIDEIVLLRLGFRVKKESGKLAIISEDFYGWIVPYLKLMKKPK